MIELKNILRASLIAQVVKNLPAMQEMPVRFLGQEDPLEKGKATQSSLFKTLQCLPILYIFVVVVYCAFCLSSAMWPRMQDLNSPTRNQTRAPCRESIEP